MLLLLMLLVTIDPRVRERLSGVWGPSSAPLMIFALAATVLVLFMLRT